MSCEGCGDFGAAFQRGPRDESRTFLAVAKENRLAHRDATVILVAYRHGLCARQ
jgi:hypothetical protein